MKKMKSITLSNIRRFGPEATIEFSLGATILLAPNGTGKTAVFEAIEFGLTGKIARLGDNLSPIIRDSQQTAEVRLNFGEFETLCCVNNKGKVKQQGDLTPVFPGTNTADIPYLLRLTHLLDQRERDWFVQADAKIAGSQLAKLPIGRDGSQASTVLMSARRYLTEQLNQAQKRLRTIEVESEEWLSLAQERDLAAAQMEGPLRAREQIAEALLEVSRVTQSSDQLPSSFLTPPARQDSLETVQAALDEILQAKVQQLRTQILELADVSGLIEQFETECSRVDQLNKEYTAARVDLDSKKQDQDKALSELNQLLAELGLAEQRRTSITQQLEQQINKAKAKDDLERRTVAFQKANEALTNADAACAMLSEERQRIDHVRHQHEQIQLQLDAFSQEESDLKITGQLIDRWGELIQKLQAADIAIKAARVKFQVCLDQYQEAVNLRAENEIAEAEARNHLKAQSSAADVIRQAVSSIAAHLRADRGDCPLCGEDHGSEKLHERVKAALGAIDPNLVQAERQLKVAGDKLRESDIAALEVQAAVQVCRSELAQREVERSELGRELDEIKSNRLLGGESIPLARESVRQRLTVLDASRRELIDNKSKLASLVPQVVSDQNSLALDVAVRSLESARQNRTEAFTRLEQATASYSAYTVDDASSQSMEQLSFQKAENANQITSLTAKAETDQSALNRQQAQLTELDSRVLELESQLAEARSRLAAMRTNWQQLSLPGDPVAGVARSHELQMQSNLAILERQSSTLATLKVEIATWKKSEQTRIAQGLLDRRRGIQSEEEFFAQLNNRIDEEKAAIDRLSKLSEAIETLNKSLSNEIGNVQSHVVAVVPRWRALLKRIVRDPRFSETNLDFYSHYRKEHAEVRVPLHGDAVAVPSIASEAQMTDLQLTFLLSMAMNHQWSPWRALLLDDPTQHHDLVHAASVFDVLRDYIVDHGFQVVIATHDALQARFFMRKLQNDGIDAQIWSLVPTANGVIAKQGR